MSLHYRLRLLGISLPLLLSAVTPQPSTGATPGTLGGRVIHGEITDIKEHPWQVALNIDKDNATYLCSGSLISTEWIVTAAHCLGKSTQPSDVRVKSGVTNYIANGSWLPIEKILINEDYNPAAQENDIALLKLSSEVGGSAIPLAPADINLVTGQQLEVAGWGVTESGAPSPDLRKASVPYVENAVCNDKKSYNGRILKGMMCAGNNEGGVDSCQGDSGGPLIWRSPDGPILVGVVSWGDGCAEKLKYGVYTRISKYRNWINKSILN